MYTPCRRNHCSFLVVPYGCTLLASSMDNHTTWTLWLGPYRSTAVRLVTSCVYVYMSLVAGCRHTQSFVELCLRRLMTGSGLLLSTWRRHMARYGMGGGEWLACCQQLSVQEECSIHVTGSLALSSKNLKPTHCLLHHVLWSLDVLRLMGMLSPGAADVRVDVTHICCCRWLAPGGYCWCYGCVSMAWGL